MAEYETFEKVTVSGRIVSIKAMAKAAEITLSYEQNRQRGYFTMLVRDKGLLTGLAVRDHILITGHTTDTVFYDLDEKRVFQQAFIADAIERRTRALAGYMEIPEGTPDDGAYDDDVNGAFMQARVVRVSVGRKNNVFLTLATGNGDNTTRRSVVAFGHQAKVASELNPGDTVALCGELRVSPRRTANGEFNETVVCRDIIVLDQAETETKPVEKQTRKKKAAAEDDTEGLQNVDDGQHTDAEDAGGEDTGTPENDTDANGQKPEDDDERSRKKEKERRRKQAEETDAVVRALLSEDND